MGDIGRNNIWYFFCVDEISEIDVRSSKLPASTLASAPPVAEDIDWFDLCAAAL